MCNLHYSRVQNLLQYQSTRYKWRMENLVHDPLVLVYPLKAGSLSKVLLKTAGGVVKGGEGEQDA